MANALFDAFRNGILGSHSTRVDLDADTISMMGVDHADDTPVIATDDFMDDIASAARVPAFASVPNLASKTIGSISVGVFDAADLVFTALTGDQFESMVMFKNSGTDSTSNIIAYWDTASGIPFLPNGGDLTVVFSPSGILKV